jgi:hypothetical protein
MDAPFFKGVTTMKYKKIKLSDVATICGHHKTKKANDVLLDMVYDRPFAPSIAHEYIEFNTPDAIEAYEEKTGFLIDKKEVETELFKGSVYINVANSCVLIHIPYMRDTFDAMDNRDDWYTKCQFAMLISERQECDFFKWTPKKCEIDHVFYDPDWINKNFEKIEAFYTQYKERAETAGIYNEELAEEYKKAHTAFEEAKEALEEVKKRVISQAQGDKDKVGCLTVTKVIRKGSVQYKKIPIIAQMTESELDEYRGRGSSSWRITF